ncbi:MAG: serine hydrolase domain-containing protein [Deltaproteobacteria bacterium]
MTRNEAVAQDRFREAAGLLEEGMREKAFQAAVLFAARGEEPVLRISTGTARLSSVFDIASLTKPLVAALFFLQVQQGRIAPEDRLEGVVPSRSPDPNAPAITFLQLLSHTAGLPAYRPLFRDLAEIEAGEGRRIRGTAEGHDRAIETVLSLPLEYPPGRSWTYSDLGYMLLGLAIERIAFSSLDRLLRKEIAEPLGMHDTRYLPLAAMSECETGRIVSTGRSPVREIEKIGEVDDENAAAMGGVAGHAGVFSTAHDLFLFAREILRARRGEGRILSRVSALRMTERVAVPPGCPRTPGWDTPTPDAGGGSQAGSRFSRNTVGHLGFSGCSLWIDLDREVTVILLTNRVFFGPDNDRLKALRPRIHDAVLAAMED